MCGAHIGRRDARIWHNGPGERQSNHNKDEWRPKQRLALHRPFAMHRATPAGPAAAR